RPISGRSPLRTEPVVLFVGSIFNRRRVPELIRAFGRVARAHRDASLEIVGDDRTHPRQDLARAIADEALGERVRWHAYLPEAELQAMYGRARAFAFLSEYEGFGLTPVEALAAGIPPVVLDTAVARETCGDAALYVPAGDVAATATALEQALFVRSDRGRQRVSRRQRRRRSPPDGGSGHRCGSEHRIRAREQRRDPRQRRNRRAAPEQRYDCAAWGNRSTDRGTAPPFRCCR